MTVSRTLAEPAPVSPPPRRRAEGREDIVRSAVRLFAARGYDLVSTKEIASEAGLTIGALYHHFPSKQALYEAAMLLVLDELPEAPVTDEGLAPRAALERLVAWITMAISTDSETARLLRREFADPKLTRPISDFDAFDQPLARFSVLISRLVPGVNVALAEATITALLFGITGLPGLRRIAPDTIYSSDDPVAIARSVCALVLEGVGAASRA